MNSPRTVRDLHADVVDIDRSIVRPIYGSQPARPLSRPSRNSRRLPLALSRRSRRQTCVDCGNNHRGGHTEQHAQAEDDRFGLPLRPINNRFRGTNYAPTTPARVPAVPSASLLIALSGTPPARIISPRNVSTARYMTGGATLTALNSQRHQTGEWPTDRLHTRCTHSRYRSSWDCSFTLRSWDVLVTDTTLDYLQQLR